MKVPPGSSEYVPNSTPMRICRDILALVIEYFEVHCEVFRSQQSETVVTILTLMASAFSGASL